MLTSRDDDEPAILLPGDPEFDYWLAFPPPTPTGERGETVFLADASSGILRSATHRETDEYLYGGEYLERLASLGCEIEDVYACEDEDEQWDGNELG